MDEYTLTQQQKTIAPMFRPVGRNVLQRQCACGQHTPAGSECVECRQKRLNLQRYSINQAEPTTIPSIVHEVLRSPSHPLDPATRAFMEPRFGHDFSQVRVHTDAKAAESAWAVNALAYTVGRDVVFGVGQFAPGTGVGQRLLAHELTHVIQQNNANLSQIQKQAETDEEPDIFETEAEEAANEIVAMADTAAKQPAKKKPAKKPKPLPNPCTRTILAEGSCEFLVKNSKWVCCDPENGIDVPERTKSAAEPKKECPSKKWTPIFTCDANCDKALEKGCDDDDNWMAIPGKEFRRSKCNDVYTICANGKRTTGYVRDRSVTAKAYEVSPGIQKALGVKIGDSFKGSIYRPGVKQATIDKDKCCQS